MLLDRIDLLYVVDSIFVLEKIAGKLWDGDSI